MYSTNELIGLDRRQFLTNLGKLGVSGAALNYMTKGALAELTENPEEEVPRLGQLDHTNHGQIVENNEPPKREPQYYTIPRDKWIRVESSHNAAKRLKSYFKDRLSEEDVAGANLNNVRFEVNGEGTSRNIVIIYEEIVNREGDIVSTPVINKEELESRLPKKYAGAVRFSGKEVSEKFSVDFEQRKSQQTDFDGKYRPVPGGCRMQDTDDTNGSYNGTLCVKAYDFDLDEYVLVASGHVLEESSGHDVHQPSWSLIAGNYIGQSDKAETSTGFDAATITTTVDTVDFIAGPSADTVDWEVYGIVGWDAIKDNNGNSDYTIKKQGYKTDREEGHIKTVDDQYDNFWTTAKSEGGDSGGPHFKLGSTSFGEVAYIAGVNEWGDGSSNSGAPYIGEVEDRFNLTI